MTTDRGLISPIRRGPNSEGSQYEEVLFLVNPEESNFGGVLFFANWRGLNPEGSCFANLEGSCFANSEGSLKADPARSNILFITNVNENITLSENHWDIRTNGKPK